MDIFLKRLLPLAASLAAAMLPAVEFRLDIPRGIRLDSQDDPVQRLAAEELRKHLRLLGGVDSPIQGNVVPGFAIGIRAPCDAASLRPGEGRYVLEDGILYLYGEDRYDRDARLDAILLARDARLGLLNALYTFLDRECGVCWLFPGDEGILLVPRRTLDLPEREVRSWRLPLDFAYVRPYFWNPGLIALGNRKIPPELRITGEQARRKRTAHALWTRRLRLGSVEDIRYGHAFRDFQGRFRKTHPEYLGMDEHGGRGLPSELAERTKLCVSNPAVADQVVADWNARGSPRYFNVCPNDGTPGFCRCPDCLRLDARREGEGFPGHLTDRYVHFWNGLADRALRIRPDVVLVAYAYSFYRFAPRRERIRHPGSLLLGLVPRLQEDATEALADWRRAGLERFFLRPNDLCYEAVFFRGLEKEIFDQLDAYRRGGLAAADYDAAIGNPATEFEFYVAARALTGPRKRFADIEREYLAQFGPAAPAAREFFAYYRTIGGRLLRTVRRRLERERRSILDAGQIPLVMQERIEDCYSGEGMRERSRRLAEALRDPRLDAAAASRLQRLKLLNDHAVLTFEMVAALNRERSPGLRRKDRPPECPSPRQGRLTSLRTWLRSLLATAPPDAPAPRQPLSQERKEELLRFRIAHRDELGFCWPLLMSRPRGEASLHVW